MIFPLKKIKKFLLNVINMDGLLVPGVGKLKKFMEHLIVKKVTLLPLLRNMVNHVILLNYMLAIQWIYTIKTRHLQCLVFLTTFYIFIFIFGFFSIFSSIFSSQYFINSIKFSFISGFLILSCSVNLL